MANQILSMNKLHLVLRLLIEGKSQRMDIVITKSFDFLDKCKEWEVHEFFETCIISIYYPNKSLSLLSR